MLSLPNENGARLVSNRRVLRLMAQCESNVFFPDDPSLPPQFSDCPRQAETTRRARHFGDTTRGEPRIVSSVVKLCAICAREWDTQVDIVKVRAAGV
jgi:hypothetical protein